MISTDKGFVYSFMYVPMGKTTPIPSLCFPYGRVLKPNPGYKAIDVYALPLPMRRSLIKELNKIGDGTFASSRYTSLFESMGSIGCIRTYLLSGIRSTPIKKNIEYILTVPFTPSR